MLDLANHLESILNTTNAHSVTNFFIFLIIVIFLYSLVLASRGKQSLFLQNTSSLLTSLGILGTFVGIVIGLLAFDPKHIDTSIELLLGGLKTAFITSLAGMTAAISFKILSTTKLFKDNRNKKTINKRNEAIDILNAINKQTQYLNALWKGISGGEESSLIGQIKMLRNDANDNYKKQNIAFNSFSNELWKNLQEFSEMLSKSATEQVILALKEVITDFNNNLTEQFGENFKALDASVKKLVDWQAEYKVQLEHMIKQFDQEVLAMSDIEKSVSLINKETKEIPQTMQKLQTIIETNQSQINDISAHLVSFKEIKEQAINAFPEIQKHVEKVITEVALSAQIATEGHRVIIEENKKAQETFIESTSIIQQEIKNSTINQVDEIHRCLEALETGNSQLINKLSSEMQNTFIALDTEIKKTVDKTGQAVEKKLEMIDDSMNQEINRVMKEMGEALVRISGQFTSDYSKLTQSMQSIVRRAEMV